MRSRVASLLLLGQVLAAHLTSRHTPGRKGRGSQERSSRSSGSSRSSRSSRASSGASAPSVRSRKAEDLATPPNKRPRGSRNSEGNTAKPKREGSSSEAPPQKRERSRSTPTPSGIRNQPLPAPAPPHEATAVPEVVQPQAFGKVMFALGAAARGCGLKRRFVACCAIPFSCVPNSSSKVGTQPRWMP